MRNKEFSEGAVRCSRAEDVAAYIADALPEPEARALEAHAADCSACRELLSALVRLAEPASAGPASASSLAGTPVAATDPERARSLAGSTIGRYEILEQLGVGGMGVVHAAYDPQLKRRIALKILRDDLLAADVRSAMHERLLREARAMAQLAHPNVVAVYEVDRHDERVFIAMELVEGETFDAWLAARPRSWREVVGVCVAAGQGLAAAHAAGLVHRDFKPANVLIGRDGRARVTDFGLAHAAVVEPPALDALDESSAELADAARGTATLTGALVGTPSYMAPEQFRGEPADARSDQFSFCVALYRALYDTHPFPGATMRAMAASVAAGRVLPPRAGTRVPRRLHRLVMRGLSVAPVDRYPAMPALLGELENLSRRLSRRRSRIAAGAAVIALAGAGILSYAATQDLAVELCGGGQSKLADLWNASARARMRSAFSATGVSYAADTWSRVEPILDTYATAWTTMYRDACEATRVRGEQSELLLDRRMACLDVRRRELDQLARLLRRPDTGVVEHAIQAAHGLSSIRDCGDLAALTRPIKPPPEQDAAGVASARQLLTGINVLNELGRYAEAHARLDPLGANRLVRDYLPLHAEVAYWNGVLDTSEQQWSRAFQHLDDALWSAEASGHDEVAVNTLRFAINALENLDRFREAHDLVRRGEAALRRFPASAESRVGFRNSICALFINENRYAEADPPCRAAIELARRELDPDEPRGMMALNNMGALMARRGDFQQALDYHRDALAMAEKLHGASNPAMRMYLTNVGVDLHRLGRNDEAVSLFRRGVTLAEGALGRNSLALANTLDQMGNAFYDQKRYREASDVHRRALSIIEAQLGPQHSRVSGSLLDLANDLAAQGDYAAALDDYTRAASILKATRGPAVPDYGGTLVNICDVQRKRKRLREAQAACTEGLAVLERALGRDNPIVAQTLVSTVGPLYAVRGKSSEAIDAFERGLAHLPPQGSDIDTDRVIAELSLARLLWHRALADRPRAHALAAGAERRLRDAGAAHQAEREAATAWLATHGEAVRGGSRP